MNTKKLIITKEKYTGKTSVVSIRIPDDMIKDLDQLSIQTGKSRNELLTIMLEFALDNLEVVDS